jgi:hypothetical protein
MNKLKYITPVLIAIACFGLQQVKADTFAFDLTAGNAAISGFPGPYAHVVVNRTDTTHATITFTSLTSGNNIYLMGDGGSVAVNVNAGSWTLSGITGSNAGTGFTPGPYSNAHSGNEDGFGSFNQQIRSFDGFTHSSDTISFTLTNTGGTLWLDALSVLIANANGNLAAAHIFVTTTLGGVNASNSALATGFASQGGNIPNVPDGGATVMLLGTALGALGMARRYLKS